MPFTKLELNSSIIKSIQNAGYEAPTPIQSEAIPIALTGRDLIACAQTGTGKTAAFVLPTLHQLSAPSDQSSRRLRALILTPTRELAVQVEQSIIAYARFLNISSVAIYGGVSIDKQIKKLKKGVDIAVCTPGRMLDLMNRKAINLKKIQTLILDEADRMLDMGFIHDVRKIANATPSDRQTLLFSATLSPEIRKLTHEIQREPEMIQIGPTRTPIDTIDQHVYPVQKQQKIGLLLHILEEQETDNILIFTRTKHGADRLCWRLNKADYSAVAIHADRSQHQRQKALAGFKKGKFNILVATDIAARGIDIEKISHVINYDVPGCPEDYIHRIGRTGRAGAAGNAITFVAHDEHSPLHQIEKFIKQKFEMKMVDDFVYDYPVIPDRSSQKSSGRPGPKSRPGSNGRNRNKAGKSTNKQKFLQKNGYGQSTRRKKSAGGNSASGQNRSSTRPSRRKSKQRAS